MPKTRSQAAQQREDVRERVRKHRAQLQPTKRRAKSHNAYRKRENLKKIDRDRLESQSNYVNQLKRKASSATKKFEELKAEHEDLKEKYTLLAEEPEIDDDQATAAEAAFNCACKNAKNFQKLTGETLEEFNELWLLVKEPLAKINYRGEDRTRSPGDRQRLPDRVQFFIALVFLRQYPTYALLSLALGGLSPLSLHHYIFRVLTALSRIEELVISWPTDVEMAKHVEKPANWPYHDKREAAAAIDGTEIKVARPTKNAIGNSHYSSKKKQYALNVLLVVLLTGVIIFCYTPRDKMQDQSLFNESQVRQRFIGKPWGLIGDSGFTLNSAEAIAREGKIIGFTPYKQPRGRKKAKKARTKQAKAVKKVKEQTEKILESKGKEKKKRNKKEPNLMTEELLDAGVAEEPDVDVPSLTKSQKTYNVELSRMRVVVENTNARLKIYKVIGLKLRHYQPGSEKKDERRINPALIMSVVAGLTNRHIKKNPCRSMNWVPEKVTDEDLVSLEGSEQGDESCDEFECDE